MPLQPNAATSLEKFLDKSYFHSRLQELLGRHSKDDISYIDLTKVLEMALSDGFLEVPRRQFKITIEGQETEGVRANTDFALQIYLFAYEFGEGLKRKTEGQIRVVEASNAMRYGEEFLINYCTFFEPDYDIQKFRDANRNSGLLQSLFRIQ